MSFNGKVQLTVVGDGSVLMSANPMARPRKAQEDESDPLMASFLQFLEKQMATHPEDMVPADTDQLRRIGQLVDGVE